MPAINTATTGRPSSAALAATAAATRATEAVDRAKLVAAVLPKVAGEIQKRLDMAADGGAYGLSTDIKIGVDSYDQAFLKQLASALEERFYNVKLKVSHDTPMVPLTAAEEPRALARRGSGMSVSNISIRANWSDSSRYTAELRQRTAVAAAKNDTMDHQVADRIVGRMEKELQKRMEKAAAGGEDFLSTTLDFGVSVDRQPILDLVQKGMEEKFKDQNIKVYVDRAMHNESKAEQPNMLIRWAHGRSVVSSLTVNVSW